MEGSWFDFTVGALGRIARGIWEEHSRDLLYALAVATFALIKRLGKTVETGTLGLKFSFGRATRVCEPGFHPLIPYLQTIRALPSRARTLELPQQQVTTLDGLVYDVDASLVYRVVDVRKALVEIDDVEKGMQQMLGMAVQEVLRGLDRARLSVSSELDLALQSNLTRRLEPWGVHVDRAALVTINPTAQTARVTQLEGRFRARERALAILESNGVARRSALALLGSPTRFTRRTVRHRSLAFERQRRARWKLFESKLDVWLTKKPDAVPRTEREFVLRDAKQRFEAAHVA